MAEKSHVGMLHYLCPVCMTKVGQPDILLDRSLKKSLLEDNYQLGNFCPDCEQKKQYGYIALVENSNAKTATTLKPEDAIRTGAVVHIRREVFTRIFDIQEPSPYCFVEPSVVEILKGMMPNDN